MSETDVEKLRYAEGQKARKAGKPLHEGASKEFIQGFGGNTMPSKFGRGGTTLTDWDCNGCGTENRRYLVQCGMCGIRRSVSDQIGATDGPE